MNDVNPRREAVGEAFSLSAMVRARDLTFEAVRRIAAAVTPGMTGKMLTDYVGDARLTKYGVRFTSQVWPGDTLEATATVTEVGGGLAKFDVKTVNQNGVEVLSGYAEARVD